MSEKDETEEEIEEVQEVQQPAPVAVQQKREVPMDLEIPAKMKLLLKFLSSIDQSINLLATRQQPSTFTNIK
jgi:hypothetical protein